MTSITLPESITSIGSYAFYRCNSLISITLPFVGQYADGSGMANFGYIFGALNYSKNRSYVPSSLKEVIITNCDSIGEYVFYGCSSLISITLPESITSIGEYVFCGCNSLISITLPESLISIGSYAFSGCRSLISITLPESLTSIGSYAFYCCTSLKDIELPSSITTIKSSAFENCSSLESIVLSSNIEIIEENAFKGCSKLNLYAELEEKPEGWNDKDLNIYYKNQWAYDDLGMIYLLKYTITLDSKGVELDEYTLVVIVGEEVELPMLEKEGYIFLGWYLDGELYDSKNYKATEDIVLEARFEINGLLNLKSYLENIIELNNYTITLEENESNGYYGRFEFYNNVIYYTYGNIYDSTENNIGYAENENGIFSFTVNSDNEIVFNDYLKDSNLNVIKDLYNTNEKIHQTSFEGDSKGNVCEGVPSLRKLDLSCFDYDLIVGETIKISNPSSLRYLSYMLDETFCSVFYSGISNANVTLINNDCLEITFDNKFKINEVKFIVSNIGSTNNESIINIINRKFLNTYTITYDTQGGELEDCTQVISYGEDINLYLPNKKGYKFLGWYYNNGLFEYEKYLFTEDITLTALWEIDEFTIDDTLIVNGTKEEGKEYYLVVGWWETTALNDDGTPKITSSLTFDTVRLFYANLNLYLKAYGATDEQIKNVQFRDYSTEKVATCGEKINEDADIDLVIGVGNNINDLDGGYGVSLFEDSEGKTTAPMGTEQKLRYVALPNHEAMNNVAISVFDWIKTETGQKAFTNSLTSSDIVVVPERNNDNEEDNEFIGNQYTITYDAQGGELEDYTQVISYGEDINLYLPIKEGYEFLGWYYNGELFEYEKYLFTEDITLTALWGLEENDNEKQYFLELLRSGFVTKSVYSKKYNSGTPSYTLLKTYIGDGAAKWEQFSASSWENVAENTVPYKVAQYENDKAGYAQCVTIDTTGNPIYVPLLLKDILSGENVEAFWSETNLDNAFARLTKDNFTKQEDGTYALDLSKEALDDESYADAVLALARQMYMILQGSEYSGFYFVEEKLTSYVLTVDENGKPVSYAAEFETVKKDDGWGGQDSVYASISGTFEKIGSDSLTKMSLAEPKYEELDEAFATLKEHNYAFNVTRTEKDDWSGNSTQTITGESDGKGNFYVDYLKKGDWSSSEERFGYSQTGENTYRKYLVGETSNIWNGEEKTGSALDVLPSFLFSSALFTKDEAASTETTTVYNFDKPALLNSSYSTDASIINFGFSSIQGWSLVDLSVEVSESTIVFKNVTSASRSMEATFSKLGEVTPISATANEVKDLVAGKYTATNTVKGNEISFDITIQNDGVFAISKNGENFGSFSYIVDEKNKIILDEAVETTTFNISQTTGEGDATVTKNYTCNINKIITVDDPYNPTKVTLEVINVEEGKSWGSTIEFVAERVDLYN